MTVYKMGGKEGTTKGNGEAEDKTQFSIRLPNALLEQIEARMRLSKRSRNKEIEFMLESMIEIAVQRDREIVERIADKNATLKSSQS